MMPGFAQSTDIEEGVQWDIGCNWELPLGTCCMNCCPFHSPDRQISVYMRFFCPLAKLEGAAIYQLFLRLWEEPQGVVENNREEVLWDIPIRRDKRGIGHGEIQGEIKLVRLPLLCTMDLTGNESR